LHHRRWLAGLVHFPFLGFFQGKLRAGNVAYSDDDYRRDLAKDRNPFKGLCERKAISGICLYSLRF
jgi:hypothetical protein